MNRVLVDASRAGKSAQPHGLRLQRLARTFLKKLSLDGTELSLSLVRDAEIARINAQWRGKDTPTDVLSFPAGETIGPGPRQLGDVIISIDTAKRAAPEFETTLELELARYLAHGLLHLLGHDHQKPKQARAMQKLENALLGHAGMLSRSDEVE